MKAASGNHTNSEGVLERWLSSVILMILVLCAQHLEMFPKICTIFFDFGNFIWHFITAFIRVVK